MNPLTKPRWNPYLAGALAGLLAIASVGFSTRVLGKGKFLGASTTFVRTAGLLEKVAAAEHVADNAYYQAKKVQIDWQMLFVIGIFLGAFISSRLGRTARWEAAPPIWTQRFGPSPTKRAVGAFLGGVVALFGARLAGGCPSGHGLSGSMQLSISGFLAMAGFIVGGLIVARIVYGKGGH